MMYSRHIHEFRGLRIAWGNIVGHLPVDVAEDLFWL